MAITQTLTTFPDPPRIYQPEEEFDANADEMAGHLPILVNEINALIPQINSTSSDINTKHSQVTQAASGMAQDEAALAAAVLSATNSKDAAATSATDAAASAALAAAAATVGAEKTVYVSGSGNDTTGTGASGAPYLTVAKAVNSQPMGAVVNVIMQNSVNSGAIDVKNRTVKITGDAASRLTFTNTVYMQGGVLIIKARKIGLAAALDDLGVGFKCIVNGVGQVHVGSYDGVDMDQSAFTTPVVFVAADYNSNAFASVYMARVTKSVSNAVYAAGKLYAGTVNAEVWQCANINNQFV